MTERGPTPNERMGNDRMAEEVAARLRATNFWRAGWGQLDEVQKADAVDFFMAEVKRFAAGNIEDRAIRREEWDYPAGSTADESNEEAS